MDQETEDRIVDASTRDRVITALIEALQEKYIFPDLGRKIEAELKGNNFKSKCQSITSALAFAEILTKLLQHIGKDKHLGVDFSVKGFPDFSQDASPDQRSTELSEQEAANSGISNVQLLDRIGILELTCFWQCNELTRRTINQAMKELAPAKELVVDLRKNGGGAPSTVALLMSYFLPADIHVNSIIWRKPMPEFPGYFWNDKEGGWEHQFRTSDVGQTKDMINRKTTILTSSYTFSAAEEFAYNMQALKRATIAGEVTAGGANPCEAVNLTENFAAIISTGRALNPYTLKNWDGVGVIPDLKSCTI